MYAFCFSHLNNSQVFLPMSLGNSASDKTRQELQSEFFKTPYFKTAALSKIERNLLAFKGPEPVSPGFHRQ